MIRSLVAILLLALALVASPTAAGDDKQPDAPSNDKQPQRDAPQNKQNDQQQQRAAQIARWIAHLGDDDFGVREAASKRLIAAGLPAVEPLAAAAPSDDPEVTWRAVAALTELALTRDDATARAAVATLHELAGSAHDAAAKRAEKALATVGGERRDRAVAYLEQRGASVSVNQQTGDVTARLDKSWQGDADDLIYLQDLVGLNWLSLEHSTLTDAAIPHVARCRGIEKLYLGGSQVRGRNLQLLGKLPKLEYLSLMNLSDVGDEQLKALTAANTIEHLGLDGTSVTDAGLNHLKQFKNLKRLWLDDTKATPAGLDALKPLTGLETLNLLRLDMAGPGLKQLKDLPNLRTISLDGATLDAAALAELAALDQLRSLSLDDAKGIDDAAIHKLKAALPQCEIKH